MGISREERDRPNSGRRWDRALPESFTSFPSATSASRCWRADWTARNPKACCTSRTVGGAPFRILSRTNS